MDTSPVEIVCFAGLKKYFGSGTTVSVESGASFSRVIDELIRIRPEAEQVLLSSRVVVNEEFVSLHEKMQSVRTIFLIPPSSGG